MSRITIELLRRRSEHNEGEIGTLEEIALHQENIEKIELIGETCSRLKILLLQHNLVSRIENLAKLKRLEYLNLALNNIEVIENLEGLESLRKLDLTVNFIGDLRSAKKLRCNEHLEQLFLVGNPCADYEGYREYAIAALPRLRELDGRPIERSERIRALQRFASLEDEATRSFARYRRIREAEILGYQRARSGSPSSRPDDADERDDDDDDDDDETFWKRSTRHTPEDRVAIAERSLRRQRERESERERGRERRVRSEPKLFGPERRPWNTNQPKVPFKLHDEHPDRLILEVSVYRHLDTCHVDVDVQPEYVRATIKGKVLQLRLPCEVRPDASTAERNAITGALLVAMPRASPVLTAPRPPAGRIGAGGGENRARIERRALPSSVREYLEIGPASDEPDFSRIARGPRPAEPETRREREEDASDVPALE